MTNWCSTRLPKQLSGRKNSLQHLVLGQLDNYVQKIEFGPLPHTITKINSEWIKDLNGRAKTIKLLEKA